MDKKKKVMVAPPPGTTGGPTASKVIEAYQEFISEQFEIPLGESTEIVDKWVNANAIVGYEVMSNACSFDSEKGCLRVFVLMVRLAERKFGRPAEVVMPRLLQVPV